LLLLSLLLAIEPIQECFRFEKPGRQFSPLLDTRTQQQARRNHRLSTLQVYASARPQHGAEENYVRPVVQRFLVTPAAVGSATDYQSESSSSSPIPAAEPASWIQEGGKMF
jgi:hypothetical protein